MAAAVPNVTSTPAVPAAPTTAAPVTPATTTAPATTAAPANTFNFDAITDPDLRGYAQNKGWKTMDDAVRSYREGETLNGVPKNELIRVPKADAQQADWDKFYASVGRPTKAEEYQIPDLPGGAKPDEAFTSAMLPAMHAAGLSQRQLNAVATAWNGFVAKQMEAMASERTTASQAEVEKLHGEWPGETYGQREELARRYVRGIVAPALGIANDDEMAQTLTTIENAVGTAKFLKLFSYAGEKLGEAPFKGPNSNQGSSFGMTPDMARAKAKELMADPDFRARAVKGGKDSAEQKQLDDLARIQASGVRR